MVFCGKPSGACLPCRQKRRRCDRLEPGCTQCERALTLCPGYRDMSMLYFRDQTEAVARKVQKAKARNCGYAPSTSPASMSPQANLIPHSLSAPLEQVAISYFFDCYAPASAFSYLPKSPLGTKDFPSSSALLAPAFVLLAQETHHPRLLKQARQHYITAIAETNAALADPSLANRDVTLASILLLALFEATIFHGRSSPTSWTAHTHGATALLMLRGARQLETPIGRALFLHASINISSSCLQRNERAPPGIVQMNQRFSLDCYPDRPASDPPLRLLPILHDMSVLLADPRWGRQPPSRIVLGLRMLDARLVSIMEDMRRIWPFEEMEGQMYHRYPSYRAAKFWAVTRMLRMLLLQISASAGAGSGVLTLPDESDGDGDAVVVSQIAVPDIDTLARDIIASTSYFLNTSIHRSVAISTRCLIWPLANIAICPITHGSICDEARRQLEVLACDLGIAQAQDALNMVREGQLMEGWLHLCLLS